MENIDNSLILWANTLHGKVNILDEITTIVAGDYLLPVYGSLTILWMWFCQSEKVNRVRYQVSALVAIGSIGLTNFVVRLIMEITPRPRPFEDLSIDVLSYIPPDPSFPSNSVSVLAAIATSVAIANKKVGAILFIMAFTMAAGRLYVGVSYPSDVVGGMIIGITCAVITLAIAKLAYPTVQLGIRLARAFSVA